METNIVSKPLKWYIMTYHEQLHAYDSQWFFSFNHCSILSRAAEMPSNDRTTNNAQPCKALLELNPTKVSKEEAILNQIKWWIAVTLFIVLITLLPAFFLARGVQHWDEIGDSIVIALGVRTVALLSKLIIKRLFDFINEGSLPYDVRGDSFFTDDNPLHQLFAERKIRDLARRKNIRERPHQMASHPKVWLALILLSYIVRLAPDILGASLVVQNEEERRPVRQTVITAPDFGFGQSGKLIPRGNCVWTRAGPQFNSGSSRRNHFGYIVWQYCVDLFRDDKVDSEVRTLVGKEANGTMVRGVFHIEVITEEVFTESWEPFSNKMRAQKVFQSVLSEENKCPDEACMRDYRTDDMRIIYRLLQKVGMHERDLKGDEKNLEKLRLSTGSVISRLDPTTRTAFIVLIATVNVIFLVQSVSNTEEAEVVCLHRAVGQLQKLPGSSFDTAIVLAQPDLTRRWSTVRGVTCFLVADEKYTVLEIMESFSEVNAVLDEDRSFDSFTRNGKRFVKVTMDCSSLGWGTEGDNVDNSVPS